MLFAAAALALAASGGVALPVRAATLSEPVVQQADAATKEVSESKEVSREVRYVFADGSTAADTATQKASFTRKGMVDESDEPTWGEWTADPGNALTNPVIAGYHTATPVLEGPASPDDDFEDITVVYVKGAAPSGSDVESFGGKGATQTGKPEFVVGDAVITGYALVDADGNDAPQLTTDDGTFVIDSASGQVSFTPKGDFVGTAAAVKVRVTDANGNTAEASYTPHVINNAEECVITRTIRFEFSDNAVTMDDIVQSATFTRMAAVDAKTGAFTWGEWQKTEFPEVKSPGVSGYTAQPTVVEAAPVTPGAEPADVVVKYTKRQPAPAPTSTPVTPVDPTPIEPEYAYRDQNPTIGLDRNTFISRDHVTTYTIQQRVSGDVTSLTIADTLEPVMEFAASPIVVTGNGLAIAADAKVDGQTLTVSIPDASALRNGYVMVQFQAKIRDGANLAPYVSGTSTGGNSIASIPNYATTTLVGDTTRTLESDVKEIKVSGALSTLARTGISSTPLTTVGGVRTTAGTPATADATILVVPAIIAVVGAAFVLLSREQAHGVE